MAEKRGVSFLPGMFLGAVVGGATVFLFGTKKGKKVRRDIEDRWPTIREELVGVLEEVVENVEEEAEQVARRIEAEAEEGIEEIKKDVSQAVEKVEEEIERVSPPTTKFFHRNGERLKK